MNKVNISVKIGKIEMKAPVMAGSGTFGYGIDLKDYIDLSRLGAFTLKGTTLTPRAGNLPPRLVETPSGLLGSIGLENPGVEIVLRDHLPPALEYGTPVLINISGNTVDEYRRMAEIVNEYEGVSGIEINVSCPNVAKGGMSFGTDPNMVAEVVKAVRTSTDKTVITKFTPAVTDITVVAKAAEEYGSDAIIVANGFPAMAIDINKRKPALGNIFGGVSGPAIKPINLRLAWQAAHAVNIPVIGCGGIACAEDAIEYLLAGATAVIVATSNLVDPTTTMKVIDGIELYLERNGFDDIHDIIGLAWK